MHRMSTATNAEPEALTLAEKLFEAACAAKGIRYKRVPISNVKGHRRPDYRVTLPECSAIVEVKQVDENDEDRRQDRELRAGRSVVYKTTPGGRLRGAIRDASGQLRRASRGGIPTVVAIFDSTFSISATDPYNVKTAMYGLDAVVIALPQDRGQRPYAMGMKRAGKAALTPQHNTSVSAVVIIRVLPPGEQRPPLFLVYHNHFARVPIAPERLRAYADHQYTLGQAENGATDWIEL